MKDSQQPLLSGKLFAKDAQQRDFSGQHSLVSVHVLVPQVFRHPIMVFSATRTLNSQNHFYVISIHYLSSLDLT